MIIRKLLICTEPRNKIEEGKESWDWFKEMTILKGEYDRLSGEEKKQNQKLIIGELQNIEKREFTEEWKKLVESLKDETY